LFAAVLGLLLTAGNVLQAADARQAVWPQFLGPNRNGISAETDLIDRFGPHGPTVVWRVPGGIGMSGIVLDETQAITVIERDGKQTVLALKTSNGQELWSQSVADGYRNSMGNGPRATPTLTGDALLVYTGQGILAALDRRTGKPQWQHNVVEEFSGTISDYGMACSPLVVDGLVVVTSGAKGAAVVAYSVESGRLAWKTGDDTAGYSSPAYLTVGGHRQIVVFTGKAVVGLEPATGAQLWRYEYPTDFDCNIATPIAVGERVFISSGENHGCALLELSRRDGAFQVREAWTSFGPKSVMRNEWQTSVLLEGHLYGMDNVGGAGPVTHLNCINAKSGVRVWQEPRFGKGNLIAADGKLYVVTIKGELVIVRATPERFEELARAKVVEATRQAPSLLNGRLYLRDAREIVCVELRDPD
jgi:outer membrane protein assembly factor BamB